MSFCDFRSCHFRGSVAFLGPSFRGKFPSRCRPILSRQVNAAVLRTCPWGLRNMFLIFLVTYCREAEAPCLKSCRAEPEAFTKMNHWPSLIFFNSNSSHQQTRLWAFTFRFWWRDKCVYSQLAHTCLLVSLLGCLLNGESFQQSLITRPQNEKVFLEINQLLRY